MSPQSLRYHSQCQHRLQLLAFLARQLEQLGCLAVEQLEDGQALVGSLVRTREAKGHAQGIEHGLGQRVDPRIVQEVLGDRGMVVQAGTLQRAAALWREPMFKPGSIFSETQDL